MEEKYLPVGTVVRLKDGQKNLMVIGFMASANETGNRVFDYMGVLYPEGVISSDMNFLFNHDQIEQVLFKGFVNEEETTFKRRLSEFITNGTIDGQVPNIGNPNNQMNSSVQQQPIPNQTVEAPQMFTNNGNQQ